MPAARLLDEIAAQAGGEGAVELVESFTDRIANLVNFHLMGFPIEDTPRIVDWAREILHSEWTALNRTEKGEGIAGAFPEFARYVDDLVDSRRGASAPDDLIARLVACETISAFVERFDVGELELLPGFVCEGPRSSSSTDRSASTSGCARRAEPSRGLLADPG